MLGRALARSLDPNMFARDCGVEQLDPWQSDLLSARPRRTAICASRQVGKSATVSLMGLETAINEPNSLVILCAPSVRQSSELLRKILGYYRVLNEHGGIPELAAEHAQRLEWRNGSRILALPGDGEGKTVRGLSAARLIIFDEAAFCDDSLYTATRPMLATNAYGQMVLLSTPNGRRGFYFNIWSGGDPSWHRVKVLASECPRISQAFLDEEMRELGPIKFAQEYELAFIDDATAAFNSAIVDACFSSEVQPLWQ